jgi:hypothetical protein
MAALMLAMAAVSMSGKLAYSQQEIDPDHFDQKAQPTHQAAPAHVQKHASVVSSKRSVAAKHHRSHASA